MISSDVSGSDLVYICLTLDGATTPYPSVMSGKIRGRAITEVIEARQGIWMPAEVGSVSGLIGWRKDWVDVVVKMANMYIKEAGRLIFISELLV
jgi:hypothetical protein